MKKVTLTVPWGQYEPIVKKPEYKHSLLRPPPPQIIFHNPGLYSDIEKQARLRLRNFRIYRSR
jgi:hypothetical protein